MSFTQAEKIPVKPNPRNVVNMFVTDRIIRALISASVILLVLYRPKSWDWPFMPELTLFSGFILVTALCAWDPFYELLKSRFINLFKTTK